MEDKHLQKLSVEMKNYLMTCSRMKKFPFNKVTGVEISGSDYGVLRETMLLLEENDQEKACVRVSDIVKRMQVPAPLVSRNLKSLEGQGLIIRETDARDRRNTLVYVTDKGRAIIEDSEERLIAFMNDVVSEMGNEEMNQLTASMSRFLDCMERAASKRI